jgi:hypothetical protein
LNILSLQYLGWCFGTCEPLQFEFPEDVTSVLKHVRLLCVSYDFVCYVWFLVILCAFVFYCNCKNDTGIVECQRLKPLSVESFVHPSVITRIVEYYCVLYINSVALYMRINGLKPFCVGNGYVVVILRHAENFCIFFPEKYCPVYVGKWILGTWSTELVLLQIALFWKMTFVFLKLCLI